jgi:hypothetical protein
MCAMAETLSRRDLLERSAILGATVLGAACGKKQALSCTDTSALPPLDVQIRTTLAYVDQSTEPGKFCSNCQQFLPPPAPGSCGACKILKGPINPAGNCKSFVAKPA